MLFKGNSSKLELLIEKIQVKKETIEGSLGTEHGSWRSNTSDHASPAPSSCPTPSSGVSDANELGEDPYTLGVTESTPYACKICNKAFSRSSLLSKHEQTSHIDQLSYKCTFCPRLFKHKRSRDRHIKLHTGDKKYKCTQCQTAFSRSDHLKIHMKTHDNNKPFKCPICNRGYNTAAALTSHQQNHSKEGRHHRNRSPTLVKIHTNLVSLSNQILSQQGELTNKIDLTKWMCVYCNKEFSTMNEMQKHVNTDHEEIMNGNYAGSTQTSMQSSLSPDNKTSPITQRIKTPTYACDSCTMHFSCMEKLRLHEDCVHWKPQSSLLMKNLASFTKDSGVYVPSTESAIISSNTTATTTTTMTMTTTTTTTTITSQPIQLQPTDLSRKRQNFDQDSEENMPFNLQCEIQPSQKQRCYSESSPSRVPHILNPNEEWSAYICSICSQRLPNFSSFMVHMDIHMSVDTSSSNVVIDGYCPLCNTHYHDQHELNNHIVLHTLNFKTGFCCVVCKKAFHDLKEINRHLLENHTYTLYKCVICEEPFKTRSLMQDHMIEKHRKQCEHYTCQFCPEKVFHTRVGGEMHILQHIPQMFSPLPRRKFSVYVTPLDSERCGTVKMMECFICRQTIECETFRQHLNDEHGNYNWNRYLPDEVDQQILVTLAKPEGSHCAQNLSFENNLQQLVSENNSKRYVKGNNPHNNYYACDICGATDFSSGGDVSAHKKIHHVKHKMPSVSLQCAYCKEYCKSRVDLENHMKNHQISSAKGKRKCNICDEVFTSAMILAEHKLSHCKIVTGNACTQCKAILGDEQSFYLHQHQHSAVILNKQSSHISLPANCVVCCQTLQTEIEVKLHANFHLKHLLQTDSSCSMCGRICDSVTRTHLHVLMCKDCLNKNSECASISNSPTPLPIKSETAEMESHSCANCNLKFESEMEATKHSAVHLTSVEANFVCRLCREICSNVLELQAHLVKHSFMGASQYSCYECSAVFTSTIPLIVHMTEEHEPKKPYECLSCQAKFFFRTELDHHQFEHIYSTQNITNLYQMRNSPVICADKTDSLTKCPYCGMLGTQSFIEFHYKDCPHCPKYNNIEKRKDLSSEKYHKFEENKT